MSAGAKKELLLRCDCYCTIFAFDFWPWDDKEDSWFMEVYTMHGPGRFRYRLKRAWRVLRGGDHYLDALVISRENAARMRSFLDDALMKEWA